MLDAPLALLTELDGQPIEQLGMRRIIPLGAEVAEAANDAVAEYLRPEAIDRDARRERMLGADEPARQAEAIGGAVCGRQHRGDAALDALRLALEVAALQDMSQPRCRHLLRHQRVRDRVLDLFDLGAEFLEVLIVQPDRVARVGVDLAQVVPAQFTLLLFTAPGRIDANDVTPA